MLSRLALSFVTIMVAVATNIEGDEESSRLAWAVRRLVENCSRPLSRVGKMGPPGPKGEPGQCECDRPNERAIRTELQKMEETIERMKMAYPEAFCLVGMKSGEIPDSAISASSDHSASYCHITNSRLDQFGAWCVTTNNPPNQWIEVDLGRIRNVTGVVTQGQGNFRAQLLLEWVTSFKVEYGTTSGSRQNIMENGRTKVFSPVNFDPITKVVTRFPDPITARYVRIVPMAYRGHISMRFDLIDC